MIWTQTKRLYLIYIAALFLVVGFFLPGLNGAFLHDDYSNLVTNTVVQLRFSDEHFWSRAWFSGIDENRVFRPLSMLVFAIEHALVGEFSAYHMKLVNLLIHIINGLLIANLTRLFFSRYASFPEQTYHLYAPLAVFLLWALSPINIGNVLYIVQRMNLLAVLATLVSLNIYFYARWSLKSKAMLFFCIALALLVSLVGYGFKDNALLAILFIFAYECAQRDGFLRRLATSSNLYVRLASLVFVAVCLYLGWSTLQMYLTGYEVRPFSWQQRALIQPEVMATYMAYSLVPLPDLPRFYHDGLELFSWQPMQLVWLCLFVGGAVWALYRILVRSDILCLFTLGWFLIFHSMESTILALEPAYNHRNYLPLVGPLIALIYLLFKYGQLLSKKFRYLGLVITAYLLSFMLSSFLQSLVWGNEHVFVEFEAEKTPVSSAALFTAGFLYLPENPTQQSCRQANHYFQQSIDASPYFIGGLYGMWQQRLKCGGNHSEPYWAELQGRLTDASLSQSSFFYMAEMLSYCDFDDSHCIRLRELVRGLSNKPSMSPPEKEIIYMLQYIAAKKAKDLVTLEQVLRSGLSELPTAFSLNLGILQLLFDLGRCEEYRQELTRLELLPSLYQRITLRSKVVGMDCVTSPVVQ